MNNPVRMKQGDQLPELQATITDADGNALDLTNASAVTFSMVSITNIVKIDAAPPIIVNPATDGVVKYEWGATDTDAPGRYKAEFKATISGENFTAPNDGYIRILILPRLSS